jgi:hypothetical protein
VNKHYWFLQSIFLGLITIALIIFLIYVPESPRFLYVNNHFDESKESLRIIAEYNGVIYSNGRKYVDFKFDKEIKGTEIDEVPLVASQNSSKLRKQQELDDTTYFWNVVKLTILWTASSFCTYEIFFMSKYFAGSIYMITYLDGIAGLISTILGDQMYSRLRVKISFIFSVSLTLFGASFIFLFE